MYYCRKNVYFHFVSLSKSQYTPVSKYETLENTTRHEMQCDPFSQFANCSQLSREQLYHGHCKFMR